MRTTRVLLTLVIFLFSLPSAAEPNCNGVADKTSTYNFKTACFKHDACYSEALLTGMNKDKCDTRFYRHMKASCKGDLLCLAAAYTYYQGVSDLSQDAFASASSKGEKILALVNQMPDSDKAQALALFSSRADGQSQWTRKEVECSSLSGDKRKACLAERNSIVVPDLPGSLHLGDCNLLGIRWKNGHRTANVQFQSRKLGLPVSVVRDTTSPGDPCAGHYLD